MKLKRLQLHAEYRKLSEELLKATIPALQSVIPKEARVFGGYFPLEGEFDPVPLLQHLGKQGHTICLPVVLQKGQALVFRRWDGQVASLEKGQYGIMCPKECQDQEAPEVFITPLLAFDKKGFRLGYGGGFYDRTFSKHKNALRVGVAYSGQEVDEVPVGAYDLPLHYIVTERGVLIGQT